MACGILIAWYSESLAFRPNPLLWLIGKAGSYSCSVHLLHFFFFHKMFRTAVKLGISTENFHVGIVVSLLFFFCMVPVGYVSHIVIEAPFPRFRKGYILE